MADLYHIVVEFDSSFIRLGICPRTSFPIALTQER